MTVGLSAASAFVFCLGLTAPPAVRVRIDLVFDDPPMPRRLMASAMEEVTAIWSPYGVDVRLQMPGDAAREDALRLDVISAERADPSMAQGALGSIRFLDGVPEPVIVMYQSAIVHLVASASLHDRSFDDWPMSFRELIVGRVFGRALAHEIGHFLLRSPEHSPSGLMQWRHALPILVAPDRQRFALWPDDAARFLPNVAVASRSSR